MGYSPRVAGDWLRADVYSAGDIVRSSGPGCSGKRQAKLGANAGRVNSSGADPRFPQLRLPLRQSAGCRDVNDFDFYSDVRWLFTPLPLGRAISIWSHGCSTG